MTSAFGMVRDADLDTWVLSDRATKLVSPAGIAGRETMHQVRANSIDDKIPCHLTLTT